MIEIIIFSEEFLSIQGSDYQLEYLIVNLKVSKQQIILVSNFTPRQKESVNRFEGKMGYLFIKIPF